MSSKLDNYLRAFRKRSGLSQREVAFLLGCRNGTQVSRYEQRHRLPTLRRALAFCSILRAPVHELFAGIQETVDRETAGRIKKLREGFMNKQRQNRKTDPVTKKRCWVDGWGDENRDDTSQEDRLRKK